MARADGKGKGDGREECGSKKNVRGNAWTADHGEGKWLMRRGLWGNMGDNDKQNPEFCEPKMLHLVIPVLCNEAREWRV
jgi:hypothetical protein